MRFSTRLRRWLPAAAGVITVLTLGFVLSASQSTDAAAPGTAQAIGPFLNGALPSTTPSEPDPNEPFQLVDAFPNLPSFTDPVHLLQRPGTNTLWVLELRGRIYSFDRDPNVSTRTLVLDLGPNVLDQHDSGALSFAFHPNFGVPGAQGEDEIFIAYRWVHAYRNRDQGYVRLSRLRMNGNGTTVRRSSEEVMIQQYDDHNWHNGCAILFGPDGFLYMTVGDEGAAHDSYRSAQELDTGLFSGVLRIDVDRDPTKSHPIRRQPVPNTQPPSGWPSTYSQGYYIPNDNPFLDPDGGILEEFYCVGLRSPHRMFMDPVTNEMWIGDIGQGDLEEVSIVRRAANFEWPWMEGTRVNGTKPSLTFGIDTPPEYDYTTEVGRAVIGGHVYRGTRFPDLYGKYIFGDNRSNYIYALTRGTNALQTLERSPLPSGQTNGLTSINVDADGELYILALHGRHTSGARIRTLQRGGSTSAPAPALLSQTGVFSNLATLQPAPGVRPYELNTPLWSDGAAKTRFIAVPNDGTHNTPSEQIGFSATGNWTFPVGTVLVKHFELPGDRLETRLLAHGSDGVWYGLTYRWRDDESEADLLSGSLQETVQDGSETFTWHYPSRQECATCHTDVAGHVLGVRTRQINRDCPDGSGGTVNQLRAWNDAGMFDGAFDANQVDLYLRSRAIDDTTATWERRARSYLDSNCSQCHQPGGVRSQWDARLSSPPRAQYTLDLDPDDPLGIANARVIAPGDRFRSVLYERVNTLDGCCAMPTLAKSRIDTQAVAVLRQWIDSMDVAHTSARNLSESQVNAMIANPDFAGPLVALTGPATATISPIEYRITSTEPLNGLDLSDFAVVNGIADDLRTDGSQWVLEVLPTASGLVTVSVSSDGAWDGMANANVASNTATTNYTPDDPPPPPPPLVEPPGPADPALWMVFNETSGTTSGGAGANGAQGQLLGGASWTGGQYGGAVALDGSGWIEVPYTDALRITDEITLAAWVKADRFRDWDGVITSGGARSPWAMQLWSDGAIRFTANWAGPTGGQGSGSWNSAAHLSLGTWHHIAVTYDGATLRFYVDGQRDIRELSLNLRFGQGEDRFVLGRGLPGIDEFFRGAIDDARVYDRALTDAEIDSLLDEGAPPPVDTEPPTVSLSTPSSTVNGTFPVTVTFNEDVTGLVAGDFVVENGTAGALSGAGRAYTLEVTPIAEGTVRVTLPADVAADAAGNGNVASAPLAVTYDALPPPDTERPTVVLTTAASTVDAPFTVDVAFNESVTGLLAVDFQVQNGIAVAISGSGATYALHVVPSAAGPVRVTLPENAADDAAGNGNVASATLVVTYAPPPPAPDSEPDYPYDPALWLRFNEGTGLFAMPFGQNGHAGRLVGATWTDGQYGEAVALDGDDRVEVSCTPAIDLQNALSVSAWIRADRLRDWDAIATRGGFQAPWGFTLGPAGRLRFTANWGNPAGGVGSGSWVSTDQVTSGTWHHVAVTYDGSTLRFAVDGELDPVAHAASLTFGIGEERFVLGAGLPATDEFFQGAMDDVRVFARALTPAELRVLAGVDAPPPGSPPPATPLAVRVNFQPSAVAVPVGYIADAGANYAKQGARWYGWGFNLSHAVARRNAAADVRLDTVIALTNATWEMELPNGTYHLTLAAGDPTVATVATLSAEGVSVWDGVAIAAGANRVQTVPIQISEGRLTLTAGASMTHLAYLEIVAAP